MPFKSQAQRAFMYAKHPEIAKKWEKHTPKGKKLPKKVKKKKTKKKKTRRESLEHKLDVAFGLIKETESNEPQATSRPTLGATKGSSKGSLVDMSPSKKKKIKQDIKAQDG